MPDLKESARTGARWTSLVVVTTALVQMFRVIILARFFLESEDFGLMALAFSVAFILGCFVDIGTHSALMYRQKATDDEVSSVFWLNAGLGIIFAGILFLTAPYFGIFFEEPRIVPLLQGLSILFILDGFGLTLLTLMERALMFKLVSIIGTVSTLAGSLATLILAALGAGVWSLWAGFVVLALIRMVLCAWYTFGQFNLRFHFSFRDLKSFMGFGIAHVGERIVYRLAEQVDRLLLGKLIGASQLGLYTVASNIANMPMTHINPIIHQTALPIFSKAQDDNEKLRRGYLLSNAILMSIAAPALFGLLAVAPIAIPLLLGEKWAASVPTLQALCVVGLFYSLYNLAGSLIIAKGRAGYGFLWRLGLLIFIVPAVYLGATYAGAFGAAVGIATVLTLAIVPYYFFIVRKLLGPCFEQFTSTIGIPIAIAIFMAVMVFALSVLLVDLNEILQLTIQVLFGACLYGLMLSFIMPGTVREIIHVIPVDRVREKLLHLSNKLEETGERLITRRRKSGLSK